MKTSQDDPQQSTTPPDARYDDGIRVDVATAKYWMKHIARSWEDMSENPYVENDYLFVEDMGYTFARMAIASLQNLSQGDTQVSNQLAYSAAAGMQRAITDVLAHDVDSSQLVPNLKEFAN